MRATSCEDLRHNWKKSGNINIASGWEEGNALSSDALYYTTTPTPQLSPTLSAMNSTSKSPATHSDLIPLSFSTFPLDFPASASVSCPHNPKSTFSTSSYPTIAMARRNIFAGLNALAMTNTHTGDRQIYYPVTTASARNPYLSLAQMMHQSLMAGSSVWKSAVTSIPAV